MVVKVSYGTDGMSFILINFWIWTLDYNISYISIPIINKTIISFGKKNYHQFKFLTKFVKIYQYLYYWIRS